MFQLENISSALADPDKNTVRIQVDEINEEEIKETVESLGYIFKEPGIRIIFPDFIIICIQL